MTAIVFFIIMLSGAAHAQGTETVWRERLAARGVTGRLTDLCLVIYKRDRRLEVWARSTRDTFSLVHQYPVCALRDEPGPKLRQGDAMTPEGLYRIDLFNARSQFHRSMRIDYPNRADRIRGDRRDPGGDIYIHGNCVTAGCIAIGDSAIDELFTLCRAYGPGIPVLLFPTDSEAAWDALCASSSERQDAATVAFHRGLRTLWRYWRETHRMPARRIDDDGRYLLP